jgi:protein SCO1/2
MKCDSLGRRSVLVALLGACVAPASAHETRGSERLPVVGRAPDFVLTTQSGERLSLTDLRGKVLAVTFIYATCKDTCPILTAKMATLQRRLGADFGPRVRFVSVTVEPEVDTPAVLTVYAQRFDADPAGWSFLTGTGAEIGDVVRRYGAFAKRVRPGEVDHLFLTSLVDRAAPARPVPRLPLTRGNAARPALAAARMKPAARLAPGRRRAHTARSARSWVAFLTIAALLVAVDAMDRRARRGQSAHRGSLF